VGSLDECKTTQASSGSEMDYAFSYVPFLLLPAYIFPLFLAICRCGRHWRCISKLTANFLSHGFYPTHYNLRGGGLDVRLELPLTTGLLVPPRLEAEHRRRANHPRPPRCGSSGCHHQPLLR
jgi:hypothetical protein